MEATNVASWESVQEVLTKDNYERWKTLMKYYLMGKNLWDVVQGDSVSVTTEDDAQRRRKNAEALHIIQVSCGSKIFNDIRRFDTSQDAWNYLSACYCSELQAEPDIEQGVVDDNHPENKKLYLQAEQGNWKAVTSSIQTDSDALLKRVSASGWTVLHVATFAGHVNFVDESVKSGNDILVEMKDKHGYTALALAARYTGNVNVAKCMVEKDGGGVRENLLAIENDEGDIPVLVAAANGHKEMTRYLFFKTPPDVLNVQGYRNGVLLLERCIKAQIFDVARELLNSYKDLPRESLSRGFPALRAFVQTPSAFLSGCRFGLPQRIIYHILSGENGSQDSNRSVSTAHFSGRPLFEIVYEMFFRIFKSLNIFGIREIYEQKCTHHEIKQILKSLQRGIENFNNSELRQGSVYDAMLHAAKHGIVEFIDAMREANPDLLWVRDSRKRGVFSYAVLHRKQNVFQLIHTLNGRKDTIKYSKDVFGNNLLHLAGHLGPSSHLNRRPGAALQMQREIQWFKAVEEVVDPRCMEDTNDDDKKPHELFTETHKELVKEGEKWAKDTAKSFTLVGTLITTIMFAAAFTVPGGSDQKTGVPIFLNEKIFTMFVVADAISLFSSATSVLIFIGIMTSRYAEKDFLRHLPWKLLCGLVLLFLSVVSMMVAFCTALAIVLKQYWAYDRFMIAGASLGSIPVIALVPSQLRLIYEIFQSTGSNPIRRIKK